MATTNLNIRTDKEINERLLNGFSLSKLYVL